MRLRRARQKKRAARLSLVPRLCKFYGCMPSDLYDQTKGDVDLLEAYMDAYQKAQADARSK